ncbi:hypothetical protein HOLleu_03413 [Holothuria leucospilota]|uniref:Retrovirus-related Pol polyprotein from transposon TNT 1-94-like beta-barrel domain-containing protein n=1 Tax=Holothuria leucospilota TaxID=206669 RepID=A0A9Q1CSJ0_HOLLE|nr:hypothetical protein HOLleu_03413 [Holothuria leucospilota]
MVLKGLPESYKPFIVVVTQSEKQQTFPESKAALRSFEETENARNSADCDSMMKTASSPDTRLKFNQNGNLLVDCGATSHIVTDELKFESFDESFRPENHFVELADGSRSNRIAHKRGDANVRIMDADGRCVIAKLENALYIPTFPRSLFSVQAATAKGGTVIFHPKYAEIIHKDGVRFKIEKYGRLYYLHTYENSKPLSDSIMHVT